MPKSPVGLSTDVTVMGVSIPIPAPFGDELQTRRGAFGDPLADAIPAHVTLLGPTTVRDGELADLVEHLEAAAASVPPFTMVLRGTGTFRPVSPVVFVQVADGISVCEQLEASIRSGRFERPVSFPYHPHVTVAHDVSDEALDRAFDDLAGYAASFVVREFHLYEQDSRGMWISIREFPLGGAP